MDAPQSSNMPRSPGHRHRFARDLKHPPVSTHVHDDIADARSVLRIAGAKIYPEDIAVHVFRSRIRRVGARPIEFSRWLENSAKLLPVH